MRSSANTLSPKRPVPPEIPKLAGATNDQIDRNLMNIESAIRWKIQLAHLLHRLCELSLRYWRKRCACSISASPNGFNFPAFIEQAASKRVGVGP